MAYQEQDTHHLPCIFIAKYVEEGDKCTITELQVNRDPEQYGNKDNDHDVALFMAMLTEEEWQGMACHQCTGF